MPSSLPKPLLLCALCAFVVLSSCGKLRFGGTLSQDQVINALRAENHDLKSKVAAKDTRIAELEAKVAGPLDVDALRALPVVASLEIDRLSGVESGAGDAGTVVVYLRTLDGNERFVQGTGRVTLLVSQESDDAHFAGMFEFTPAELRAAYRSSFLGTFYVLRVAYCLGVPPDEHLTATVEFDDAVTGKVHAASRRIGGDESVKRPAPTGKQGV